MFHKRGRRTASARSRRRPQPIHPPRPLPRVPHFQGPTGLDITVYRNQVLIRGADGRHGRLSGRCADIFRIIALETHGRGPAHWSLIAEAIWRVNPTSTNWYTNLGRLLKRLRELGLRSDLLARNRGYVALDLRPGLERIRFVDREVI